MTRWLFATLLACVSLDAAACPLCMGYRPSTAQQLATFAEAVLAVQASDAGGYRVVATIKGDRAPGSAIERSAVQRATTATPSAKPLLLARDDAWPMWVGFGAIGVEHARWLREVVAGRRAAETSADEWRARAARMLPYLENAEPLVAEMAYGELAAAPYYALLPLKPSLAAPVIRRWLADPKLAARQPLYLLLLGIAGNAQDAAALEQRLGAAWESGDAANLGSLIAADLQLRGPTQVAWVDAKYLSDPRRLTPEIEAALLALSVHGNADGVIPRERVIQSYRTFMNEHKDIAGYVARDFATWQYWDAVPDYVTLLKSGVKQQYASHIAIVAYLRQSPNAPIIDLLLPESRALAPSTSGLPGLVKVPVTPQ